MLGQEVMVSITAPVVASGTPAIDGSTEAFKADHPEADKTVAYLRNVFRRAPEGRWTPPVVKTQAFRHLGIGNLWEAIAGHRAQREAEGATHPQALANSLADATNA